MLGSTQPPNPMLEGFTVGCEGKPQPCWYGYTDNAFIDIQNGAYPLTDLNGYTLRSFSFSEELFRQKRCIYAVRKAIAVTDCVIKLGEIREFWGKPVSVTISNCGIYISFKGGNITLEQPRITIESEIDLISISTAYEDKVSPDSYKWAGFLSVERYRFLDPSVSGKRICGA